eukprot:jgi/Undpi1/13990/HiC_scaffold_9.g03641.m1
MTSGYSLRSKTRETPATEGGGAAPVGTHQHEASPMSKEKNPKNGHDHHKRTEEQPGCAQPGCGSSACAADTGSALALCLKGWLAVFIAAFGRALSAAHAITSWGADKALTAHYEKATTSAGCAILCGTLAGCGGGILADLLNLQGHSWNLQCTPTALASPSFSVQRCFGASCLYYILADPHGLLNSDAPFPLSWLGSWSVSHGVGPSTEAAAMVALYVTANHLMDYFIPHFEDPLCKVFKLCLGCIGVHAMVNPKPIGNDEGHAKTS